MTADRIAALLEPIQNRLNAATPGPWFREYGDVITNEPDPRDVEEGYDDPRSLRIARAAPHLAKREPQGIRNADFIANAPTDQARLLAAVQAVIALHKPERLDGRPIRGCRVCDWEQPGNEGWPCATVSAVVAALGGEA